MRSVSRREDKTKTLRDALPPAIARTLANFQPEQLAQMCDVITD